MLGFRGTEGVVDDQVLGSTNHLIDSSESKLGHDASELFDDVVEEVDDLFGLTSEFGTESRVLGSNTDGTSVSDIRKRLNIDLLVTSLHHDTTHSN